MNGEELHGRIEPRNVTNKYAVCVSKNYGIIIGGYLIKGITGRFAKTIFYFLRANHGNICTAEVAGKPVNLGNGKAMQALNFSGQEVHINILKELLRLFNIFLLQRFHFPRTRRTKEFG